MGEERPLGKQRNGHARTLLSLSLSGHGIIELLPGRGPKEMRPARKGKYSKVPSENASHTFRAPGISENLNFHN